MPSMATFSQIFITILPLNFNHSFSISHYNYSQFKTSTQQCSITYAHKCTNMRLKLPRIHGTLKIALKILFKYLFGSLKPIALIPIELSRPDHTVRLRDNRRTASKYVSAATHLETAQGISSFN